MLIFAIDDEPKMLRLLHKAIGEAAPQAEIRDFPLGSGPLDAMAAGARPDIVFSDIQMPPPTGLDLAIQMTTLAPEAKIVFVTGYDEYAVEAFRIHAVGYIVKPVSAERIREEIDCVLPTGPAQRDRIQVQCFGYFEAFWQGAPLPFSRSRTKELFALLVDRRGAACTADEAIASLYEPADAEAQKKAKHNLRNLINDLKTTLLAIGQGDVLIRKGGNAAFCPEKLDCDYYRMLSGDMQAVNAFRGAYMEQYSWAEMKKGMITYGHYRDA